jgi:thioredoxin-dependent peroxiredoxin
MVANIPAAGDNAPEFTLPEQNGETLTLSSVRGKYVVLYFYPKNDTPGCTLEAQEFAALAPQFKKKKAVIVGISPDSVASHCRFAAKHTLNFHLLADEGHKVAELYGVWAEKSMYGRRYMGVQRTTFLIDSDGRIVKVWPRVRPKGHAEEVLRELLQMH